MHSEVVPVYKANDVAVQLTVNHENLRAHRTGILSIFGFLYFFLFFTPSVLNPKNVKESENALIVNVKYCHQNHVELI